MSRPVRRVEFEPEDEVDLGRYATALAARWWLALLGLVAGAIVGFLLTIGGADVYRAHALVDLGSPQAPGGGTVQGPSALVNRAREIARADETVHRVAAVVGLRPGQLRAGIAAKPVTSGTGKPTATTLLDVSVKGDSRRKVTLAVNDIARIVVVRVSPYVTSKIAGLRAQVTAERAEIASLTSRIDAATALTRRPGVSPTDKLIALSYAGTLEQRLSNARDDEFEHRQLLALAQNVERPTLLERGVAGKTTARSRRNSVVVGAVLGLLLGLVAALLWEPVAAAVARRR